MTGQESVTNIQQWIEIETRHIDVVASWESLCDTYDVLRFTDQLADAERLEEFKWIVQQMNVFLTKIRKKMLSCRNLDAMIEMLEAAYTPAGKMELSARRALVFQKLRQQWIKTEIMRIEAMKEMEEQDGWTE